MSKSTIQAAGWVLVGMVLMGLIVWFTMPSLMLIKHKSNRSYDETVAVFHFDADLEPRQFHRLDQHMGSRGQTLWFPDLDGQRLKVRAQETTSIEYDEETLRQRLGSRYALILAPDPQKIRRSLPQLADVLSPVMDLVGSPAPDKVRAAIEGGQIAREEFAGAFKRTIRRLVAVARIRPDEPGSGDAGGRRTEPPPS